MKKGFAMTRLQPGARLMKMLSAFMAFSIFATPIAYAQTSNSSAAPAEAQSESKGALTFTRDAKGDADAGGLLPAGNPLPVQAAPAAEASADTAKPAEVSGAEPAAEDGTALAQTTGGTASKKLDPLYRYVQEPPGFKR